MNYRFDFKSTPNGFLGRLKDEHTERETVLDAPCIEDLLELVRQSVELHEQAKAAKLRTPLKSFAGQWSWKEKGGDAK